MKKLAIGLILLISTISFGATPQAPKNDAAKPYYNSGFSFGLAAYSSPNPSAPATSNTANANVAQTTPSNTLTIYK